MKVFLFTLNASYIHKSLALRCLKKSVENEGFETVCAEFTVKEKRLHVLERLSSEKADIYCFSCYIWNIDEMLSAAEKLKKLLPDSVIVFGGPEVSYESEEFFSSHEYVDFIVQGEGEETLPALCRDVMENGRDMVKRKGRIIHSNPYAGFAGEGILYSKDDVFSSSVIYYESSRGCPFSCSYCLSAAGHGIRSKSARKVLEELLELEKLNDGIKIIKFVDRTFNFDKKRAYEIWRGLLSGKYTGKYHFEICAELLDEEGFDLLSRFPVGKIQLEAGVQSTNPKTLAAINRKSDTEKCIENIRRIKEMENIHIHADLIAGLPLEDINSFAGSFDDVYGSCHMLHLGFLKLLKGSPLYKEADKYGIICSDHAPYEVLKTDAISFEDLLRLHKICDVLDRISNSGHFSYSLAGILEKVDSPFGFFSSLSEYIGNVDLLSQLKLMELFHSFCIPLSAITKEEVNGRLRLDFYIHEAGSCPAFLSGGGELPVPPVYRGLAIRKAGVKIFAPAAEVHRFSFDPSGYYLIDRKNHFCERWTEEEIIKLT